ncbi:MAG: alpha/beta fold hydrolase [Streptosporangiaceae bacterium]
MLLLINRRYPALGAILGAVASLAFIATGGHVRAHADDRHGCALPGPVRYPDGAPVPVRLAGAVVNGQPVEHRTEIPGGSPYYRTQGAGPALVLIGGGPSNADTLRRLAGELTGDFTVVTYDRRGYSRSHLDDPAQPATIAQHGDDVRRLVADLGAGPATVFGTSIGALIALALAASAPAAVAQVIVHEPPLGQLLTDDERPAFDLDPRADASAGSALDAIAKSIGVNRGLAGDPAGRPEIRPADVELFIRRDAPAVGAYRLDLARLVPLAGRIVVAGSQDGRDFYPYQCALRLACQLGTPLAELPGNHAGMIQHPVQFAAELRNLLLPSAR